MLKQLLKYEFQATRATFGALYLALIAAAGLLGVSLWADVPRSWDSGTKWVRALLILVYTVLVIVVAVGTFCILLDRFYKNLLGAEGYLMHTLPVRTEQLILSKLLAGLAWCVCSALAGTLSVALLITINSAELGMAFEMNGVVVRAGFWEVLFDELGKLIAIVGLGRIIHLVLALLVLLLAFTVSTIVHFYAACMIGHLFKRFFTPAAVVAFFVLSSVQSFVARLLNRGMDQLQILVGENSDLFEQMIFRFGTGTAVVDMPTIGQIWLAVLPSVVFLAVFAALYFAVTDWLMKNRLEL